MRPVFATCPVIAKVLVPGDDCVPSFLNSAGPDAIIMGTEARVSTLFITVGFPNSPDSAGKGGFGLGIPLWPSIDVIRAVSSPQTKAPAPSITWISRSWPVPKIPLPSMPLSIASLIADFILSTASGYSALT